MPKIIPIVVTNTDILVKERDTDKFNSFKMPAKAANPNIPFYHQFAEKISECQYYFKEYIKSEYGKSSKYVLALIVPDDTSPLEKIFLNEFFLHSGAGKAIAQSTMSRVLTKSYDRYISLSRSSRNIVLQYINCGEVLAERMYDVDEYDPEKIKNDAQRIHIDVEYAGVPIFINDFAMNMEEFHDMGVVISTKEFLDKIANIDIEKV